jgi:two-component system, LytTR family, response regulator
MLRCFIAEDEAPARERLKRLLAAEADVVVVGEAADGVTTLQQLGTLQADLVLLDIEMPELDGLGVAAALDGDGPAVIFVTAYDEHALRAFELSAIDYLVKPVRPDRLSAALGRLRKTRSGAPGPALELAALARKLDSALGTRRMAVRCGAKFLVFDPADVYGILSKDHYSAILLDATELYADDSLEQLARRFDAEQYLRVHRGAIINLAFLRELVHEGDRRYVAVLADRAGTRIAVSRERLPALKSALGLK